MGDTVVSDRSLISSYITILSRCKTSKCNTDVDLIMDLRNKLAAPEFSLPELRNENEKIKQKLKCAYNKLNSKDIVINNLHVTVDNLSSSLNQTSQKH